LASKAVEGRGIAAISSGKPLAGSDPEISETGKPTESHVSVPRKRWNTQGSETSQYLQERKANATPPVAASDRGSA
jgi:hypothetical protein